MGIRRLTQTLAVAALVVCAWTASAGAQTAPSSAPPPSDESMPTRVRVVLPACEPAPFQYDSFVSVLRIELETDGVDRVDVAPPNAAASDDPEQLATIVLDVGTCSPDAREITLRIDDAATSKHVERVIATGDVPRDARPRALALAVAELLRASWSELSLPNAPPPPATLEPAVRRIVTLRALRAEGSHRTPRTVARADRLAVGADVDLRMFPAVGSVLGGARAIASIPVPGVPMIHLRADLGALYGNAFNALGSIDEFMATAAVGVTVAGGAGAVRGEVGPRLELGAGWVSGRPTDPRLPAGSGADPIAFASIVGSLRVRLATGWWMNAEVEAGFAFVSLVATVNGAPAGGFWGPMAGIRVGFAGEP